MSEEGTPLLQVTQGVASVRLRRPSQRNSLNDTDLHVLLDIFARIEVDTSVRVVVLSAETAKQKRPVFCAGYHVGGFDSSQHDPKLFEKIPEAIEALRPITICALNGSVYGGATDLMLACDLRIALAGGELRMPACALGLHYYPSGMRRYVSRLGLNGAKRMFLSAKAVPVEQLQVHGLFEQVVDAENFDAVVSSLVKDVAALAPLAAQATKRSLNEIAAGKFDEARLREREALTLGSADFVEGRSAMAEKRTPSFVGR